MYIIEKRNKVGRKWTQAEVSRRHIMRLKCAVMNVLTNGEGTCRQCGQGDIDVLTVDHIENDGFKHRKQLGKRDLCGDHFYRWLVKNDYPPGYQVLCMNCNMKKEIMRKRGTWSY